MFCWNESVWKKLEHFGLFFLQFLSSRVGKVIREIDIWDIEIREIEIQEIQLGISICTLKIDAAKHSEVLPYTCLLCSSVTYECKKKLSMATDGKQVYSRQTFTK